MTPEEIRKWARAEARRRSREEGPLPATVVLPALDRFSDEYAPAEMLARLDPQADPEATGPHSRTVRGIICGGCCGWPEPPTSEEVYEAIRAENRSTRQRAVVTVLTNEASFDELMNAYIERAFTWRQLARALAEQGGQPAERAALVRCFAASA